jgi:putative transposase
MIRALAPEVLALTIPLRGKTGFGVYFVTSNIWLKKHLLQSFRSAGLLIEVLYQHRAAKKYLIHEFVVMPNHFHALLTPLPPTTLERGMGLIKGGFSFQAQRALGFPSDIWQSSFVDRRVRDIREYLRFRAYIHQNPVKAHLAASPQEFPFSSASGRFELDEVPQWLKPVYPEAKTHA